MILERLISFKTTENDILQLFQAQYDNVTELDGENSKWLLKETLKEKIANTIKRRQMYLEAKTLGNFKN